MSDLSAGSVSYSYPSVLMYHELPIHGVETQLLKKMSGRKEALFPDEHYLFSNSLDPENWDCPGCPPPEFHLPPPPRPPWMQDLDDCEQEGQPRLSDLLQHSSTCDSNLHLVSTSSSNQSYFEDTFHSIAVVVVCSVILVILLLTVGVFIFKKRKSLYSGSRQCPSSGGAAGAASTLHNNNGLHHQQSTLHHMTLHKVGNELRHHLGAPCVGAGPNQAKPCEMVVNANGEMQVIHTACGCSGGGPTPVHSGGSASTTMSGGNHYIPEMAPKMILVNSDSANRVISGVATLDPLRQHKELRPVRFEPPASRNVMTLSARPPMAPPPPSTPAEFPPHIVIGGQPFYLVPTTSGGGVDHHVAVADNYTYPQMPIYEEIPDGSRTYGNTAGVANDFEYNYIANGGISGQGPFMTSERRQHPLQVLPGDILMPGASTPSHHAKTKSNTSLGAERPHSSSTSNSQHTHSSEISSCNSDEAAQGSSQDKPRDNRVMVNPMLDVTDEIKRFADNSFTSDYVNSSTESPHGVHGSGAQTGACMSPPYRYPPRLADGFERCRSPQSIYSAKLALKARASPSSPSCSSSGNSSGGSKSNSSVYYYSDTLRKPQATTLSPDRSSAGASASSSKVYQNSEAVASPSKLLATSDDSDSGIAAAANKFELSPMTRRLAGSVNTKVVVDKANGSELV